MDRVAAQRSLFGRLAAVSGVVLAVALFATTAASTAKDGRPEVNAAGACGGSATSKLRLRGGDDGIEVRFEVEHTRPGFAWRIVLVHERRIAWKGVARTTRPGGSFEVNRTLRDLPGADALTVRAVGPNGVVCRAAATLSEF